MRCALLVPFCLASLLSAQNFVPNGHFDAGAAGWTMTQFNDPLGTTGFGSARVAGNGPSEALYADFYTLTPVMSATWRGPTITLPAATLPVSFNVMWEKQTTPPIPSVSVNRVELRIFDATNTRVFLGTRQAPNQTGLLERASFSGSFAVPAAGAYTVELFLRHSNLANMPFKCWVDDVVIGGPDNYVYGQGCAGSGGVVPVIGSLNAPAVNSSNFTVQLNDAWGGPTAALFLMDLSDTSAGGLPLPYPLGGGCDLRTGTTVLTVHVLQGGGNGAGSAGQVLGIPNLPGLAGLRLFTQFAVNDPAAQNTFGLTVTPGYSFVIR